MLLWAAHDGGFDADTWYWGALVSLALLAASLIGLRREGPRLSRASGAALLFFALYVAWSYLSITWAQSPGDALQGSNRALLYLLMFGLLVTLPWTPEAALAALLIFVLGVGVIAIDLLLRLGSGEHGPDLLMGSRLIAPTGYINSTAALFTVDALMAIVLAARRGLPGLLRGLLIAVACAGLQLALIVQSRGWLFTLPIVVIVAIVIVADRLRVAAAAVVAVGIALVPVQRLLEVYGRSSGAALNHTTARAGQAALLSCAAAFVAGTLIAWGDKLIKPRPMNRTRRRLVGAIVTSVAIAGFGVAGVAVTHGRPFHFISRQWHGFTELQRRSSGSHFTDVGSGRFDFWRVGLKAVLAHPVGGLGQDNFADYYIKRRRTGEEPSWTHSLEIRLLVHTGVVGFGLFAGFLLAALMLALRARRRDGALARGVAGIALLPLVVWLIHGSVDWFWEIPALAGPALGFLGVAGALTGAEPGDQPPVAEGDLVGASRRRLARTAARPLGILAATTALIAATVVLGASYLSVRDVSLASDARYNRPVGALRDLARAASLNPLSAVPGRLAGTIALQGGFYGVAEQRFSQSIAREPGGWFSWLGAGLAASAQDHRQQAQHDFKVALSINSHQPAIRDALNLVYGRHPLTSAAAFKLLRVVQ